MARFAADLDSDEARRRVEEDLREGRRNGVTGTPTLFIDGIRYDGAWDFYSHARGGGAAGGGARAALRARVREPAGVGRLVLLLAAAAALVCANTPLRAATTDGVHPDAVRHRARRQPADRRPSGFPRACWRSSSCWSVSRSGVRSRPARWPIARAAVLPVVAAVGGVLAPAAIYLALNRGADGARAGRCRRPRTSRSPSASWRCWAIAIPPACACSSRRWPWSTTCFRC